MIAVLMGGYSAEREISLKSGKAVYEALLANNVDCFAFDLTKDNLELLWKKEFDKAFIILHGRGGEDGFIQSQLESRGIPFTGSDSLASELCMNKATTKEVWQQHLLPLSPSIIAIKASPPETVDIPLPWAVKPILEGSSIGISKVMDKSELDAALKLAWQYGDALIECWIEGSEYTVAVLNGETLPSVKIVANNEFYDYDSKYFSDNTEYLCPADLSEEEESYLQTIAMEAFRATGASGWGRVDFVISEDKTPYLLEINTVPGMTSHSLVPMAAKAKGINFEQLVLSILNG
ncbi:MAG: D-alanine--D-alanine ligase [Gammaproteobacteria bacterium]|nr:D-alanine--D-alanine ligase [Gammaproteobacteria bacterium]